MTFQPMGGSNLKSRVLQEIRDAITEGRLSPGEKIVERKLAQSLRTSLTTVREALIHLEVEGFITKVANTRSFVTQFSWEQTRRLFQVRKWLEQRAVELAAVNGTKADQAELKAQLNRVLEASRANRYLDYLKQDLKLHEIIWKMSGNEFLDQALRRIVMPLYALTICQIRSEETFSLEQDALSHKPIVEAILAQDDEAAVIAFLAGIREWELQVVSHMSVEKASSLASDQSPQPVAAI
jgi:DNA-binding GntR family transcriptional regulator